MVKFILIKSPDEWAATKRAYRDELVVYLFFSSIYTSLALLLCIEHCFTNIKFHILCGKWESNPRPLLTCQVC